MSLLRLLTAGKCLVGNNNNNSRYRMSKPGSMPKFGSPTQFRSAESAASAKAMADKPAPGVDSSTALCAPEPENGSVLSEKAGTAVANNRIPAEESPACPSADIGGCSPSPDGACSDDSEAGNMDLGCVDAAANGLTAAKVPGGEVGQRGKAADIRMTFRKPAGTGLVGTWARRLWARLTGFSNRAPRKLELPAAAPNEKQFVQTELSLDMVQVVRNDLSDTDLEIVPQGGLPEAAKSRRGRLAINAESASLANAERA